jgi:hypothetical protein
VVLIFSKIRLISAGTPAALVLKTAAVIKEPSIECSRHGKPPSYKTETGTYPVHLSAFGYR